MADVTPQVVDDGKVAVTIDGRTLRVPKGTLILDAANELGIHIPIYCAHPKMDPVAVCRMCLVAVEKMPKLQPACATVCGDGMVVTTNNAPVAKAREGMLEFLLLNHPLDCPVCDRGGECDLQDFSFRYGPETSRFPINEKEHFNKAIKLSQHIELDQERCILCWRCVRYYDEITGEKELVLQQRGVHTLIDTFNGEELKSEFQGNLPEVCPVGALTHREYRFVSRPWDLQRAPNICPECSYGCNINIDSRDFAIKRFASRDNPAVEDMWLCDRGRYSFERWNDSTRVRRPLIRDGGKASDVSLEKALGKAVELLEGKDGGSIGILASTLSTNEELWLLQRLAREVLKTDNLDHQLESFEELTAEEHALGIQEIERCKAVVVLGEEPEKNAPVLTLRLRKAATKKKVKVIRLGSDASKETVNEKLSGIEGKIGLIADESNRVIAKKIAGDLGKSHEVAQMTVTRGANGRGAKDLGILPNYKPGYREVGKGGKSGREILEATIGGDIEILILLDGASLVGLDTKLFENALKQAKAVIAIESRPSVVSENATVLIPGHAYVEKIGSVTNLEGRVQRIRPALPPATNVMGETKVLAMLASKLGADFDDGEPIGVHRALRDEVYSGVADGARVQWKVPVA